MGVNLNVHVQRDWETGKTEQTTPANNSQATERQTFEDNVVSLGGLRINFNYTSDSSAPSLPSPDLSAHATPPPKRESKSSEETKAYFDTFSAQLEVFAEQHKLTEDQVNTLIFAQLSGEAVPDDTFLNEVLGDIQENVKEQLLETFGEDAFPPLKEMAKSLSENGSSLTKRAREKLAQLESTINALPDHSPEKQRLKQMLSEAKGNLASIEKSISQLHTISDRPRFGQLLNQLSEQMEGFENFLASKNLTSDPILGRTLEHSLVQMREDMEVFSDQIARNSQDNHLAQGNWNLINSEIGQSFMGLFEASYTTTFEEALSQYAKKHGLSQKETGQIRFSHYNSSAAADSKVLDMRNAVREAVESMMSPNWGAPAGYVPHVDNAKFNAEIEMAYDEKFETLVASGDLKALSDALGVSEADTRGMLVHAHYLKGKTGPLPDAMATTLEQQLGIDNNQLKSLLKKLYHLENAAQGGIPPRYGVPEGHQLQAGSENYFAMLNGRFLQQFDANMRNLGLTPQQINQVTTALADPLNPNITNETKTLIQQLYSKSVQEIRGQYNLPAKWAPPVTTLGYLNSTPAHFKAALAGIEEAEDTIRIAAELIDPAADNPAKAELINVLKIVAEAIANLKEQIAQMQVLDAQRTGEISQVRADMAVYKTQLAIDKLEKIRKKKGPLGVLGKIMKVFAPIMKVLSVVMVLAAGPVGFVIAGAMLQDLITGGKDNYMTKMFESIMEAVPGPYNILASMAVVSGLVMAGNAQLGIEVFFTNTGVLQEIVLAAGGSEMTAEIVNMATQLAVEIVVLVTISIITAGAGTGLLVGRISQKVGQISAKVTQNVGKLLQKIGRLLERIRLLKSIGKFLIREGQNFIDKSQRILAKLGPLDDAINLVKRQRQIVSTLQKSLAEAKRANRLDDIASFTAKLDDAIFALKKAEEDLEKLTSAMQKLYTVYDIATNVVEIGTAGVQAASEFIRADIAKLSAEYDAEIEQLQALIKILREILQKLMQGIESQSTFMLDLGRAQNQMWRDLSQTASVVAAANQA